MNGDCEELIQQKGKMNVNREAKNYDEQIKWEVKFVTKRVKNWYKSSQQVKKGKGEHRLNRVVKAPF